MVGTWKVTQTITNGIQHLLKCRFRLCHCQSPLFSIAHIFLLVLHCCLCIINSHSRSSGHSFHIVVYSSVLLLVASEVLFMSLPSHMLHFGSLAAPGSRSSDCVWLQPAITFICLLMSSCGALCSVVVFDSL